MNLNQILCGDALDLSEKLQTESVHTIITSPPYYGLRDYHIQGKVWDANKGCDHRWDASSVPHTKNRSQGTDEMVKNPAPVSDQGKIEPGSVCNRCGAWFGVLGQEPTPELYIGHLVEIFSSLRRALRPDGTLWIVIGDSYARGCQGDVKQKDLLLIPDMLRIALRRSGWWIRATGPWIKPNGMPETAFDRPVVTHEDVILCSKNAANPLFWTHEEKDGRRTKPESEWFYLSKIGEGRRDYSPGERDKNWVKKNRWQGHDYYFDDDSVRVPYTNPLNRWGGEVWTPDTESANWLKERGEAIDKIHRSRPDERGRRWRTSDIWAESMAWIFSKERIGFVENTISFSGAHFATFPPGLVGKMIIASTPAKVCEECGAPWARGVLHTGLKIEDQNMRSSGVIETGFVSIRRQSELKPTCDCGSGVRNALVLDPFVGSGTTCAAAALFGRNYLGFDTNPDYVKMAEARIAKFRISDYASMLLDSQCQLTI